MGVTTWKISSPASVVVSISSAKDRQTCTAFFDGFHDVEKIAQGTGKVVIFRHHHHVTVMELIEHLAQLWPLGLRTAHGFRERTLCAGLVRGVMLSVQALVTCRYAGIANYHAA